MSDWLDHYERFVNGHHSFGSSTSTSRKEPLRVKEIPSNNDNFGWDDREDEDKTTTEILDGDNNLEQRFALLENKEDINDTDDTGKENKNTTETSSENEEDNEEENVDMFKKPMCEGWERECIMRDGEISQVYYLSPTMADGRRRRFKQRKTLMRFLRNIKSGLLERNFSFDRKFLRIDGELEREAKAVSSFTYQTPAIFYYREGCQDESDEKGILRGRKGTCSLCEDHGLETEIILHESFLKHMKDFHLPEESCEICGREIPANVFQTHWEYCDGDNNVSKVSYLVTDDQCLTWSQRYLEKIPSGSKGRQSRGRCKLCSKLVSAENFQRHMRTYHVSAAGLEQKLVGVKPGQDEEFHPITFDRDPIEKKTNSLGVDKHNKIPRLLNVENEVSYVQMRMRFIGNSPKSKIIRLQSDTTVLRAMRKFSKLVKEPMKSLKFSCEEIEIVGSEFARDLVGTDIIVESRRLSAIL